MLPKALKSCPKSNKSPNLVTLPATYQSMKSLLSFNVMFNIRHRTGPTPRRRRLTTYQSTKITYLRLCQKLAKDTNRKSQKLAKDPNQNCPRRNQRELGTSHNNSQVFIKLRQSDTMNPSSLQEVIFYFYAPDHSFWQKV